MLAAGPSVQGPAGSSSRPPTICTDVLLVPHSTGRTVGPSATGGITV